LPDIPAEVKESLKFHFVENVDQVLRIALGAATPEKKPAKEKAPKAERNQGVGARAGRF
jgi:ATP-dependent Lon protease